MSSTPRSRPLSGVLFAALVIAILIAAFFVAIAVGLNPAQAVSRVWESFFPPVAATNQGASIRQLYDIVFIIAAVIFFVVEGLILWTVLRYRRRPGDDELPPQTHGNTLAEALWTIIPTIIVAFLFAISWGTLNTVESLSATPELKVRAYAAQFQWQFDYYDESGENIVYTQLVPQGEGGGMALRSNRTFASCSKAATSSTRSTCRSSSSNGTSSQAASASSTSRSSPRTQARCSAGSAPSCAVLAIGS